MALWKQLTDIESWKPVLRQADEYDEFEELRQHTRTGRPYGSESFLKKLEQKLQRRVKALPVRRPKVKQKSTIIVDCS